MQQVEVEQQQKVEVCMVRSSSLSTILSRRAWPRHKFDVPAQTSQRGKIKSDLGCAGSAADFYVSHNQELVRNPKNQIRVHQIGVRRPGRHTAAATSSSSSLSSPHHHYHVDHRDNLRQRMPANRKEFTENNDIHERIFHYFILFIFSIWTE